MKQQGGKWGLERQGVTIEESRQNFSRVSKAAQAQADRLLGGNTEQLCDIFHTWEVIIGQLKNLRAQ